MTRRLVLGAVLIALLALSILAIPFTINLVRAERSKLENGIERDASVIATYVVNDLANTTGRDLQPIAIDYTRRTGGRLVITDINGYSVADSELTAPRPGDFSSRPEVQAALRGEFAHGNRYSQTLSSGLAYVAVPVASGGVVHGVVRITYLSASVDRAIRSRLMALFLTGLFALGVAAILALLVARWIAAPLRTLRAATSALSGGDLTARADEDRGPPEVRNVAASFNDLAERLDELIKTQRAFVADASHQLRTPLTALRLRLDEAQVVSETKQRDALEAASDEVVRMQRMIDALLVLARADGARPAGVAIDVSALVADRLDQWTPFAEERGVALRAFAAPGVSATLPVGVLDQVVDNLLDNAIDHAPHGSSVEIAVLAGRRQAVVTVADHGPGMTREEQERAFDRFWRGAHPTTGGTGLGLAIVDQLVVGAGGSVSLEDTAGGGLTVRLVLPKG